MGRTKCSEIVRTETGKILALYRIKYGETVAKQAKRLGFNPAYISLISNGHKTLTPAVFKSVVEHYSLTEENKAVLLRQMCEDDRFKRLDEVLPGNTLNLEDKVYLLTGYRYEK